MSTVGTWQGPKIIKDGLVFYMDPANYGPYPDKTSTRINDASYGYNPATLQNGAAFVNVNGGVFSLDGTNDFIAVTAGLLGTQWTMSAWFNVNTITYPEGLVNVFSLSGAGWYVASLFGGVTNRNIAWYIDGSWRSTAAGVFTTNTWYNLTAMVRGKTYIMYLNGVAVMSYTSPNDPASTNLQHIGKIYTTVTRLFPGYIGQCLAYNRALTAAEVLENFNVSKAKYGL